MQLLLRFLIGGTIVSLFALAADALRPKSFSGLFGGAPSVALATLALTVWQSGLTVAATEARSMTVAAGAFIAYSWVAARLLKRGRWSSPAAGVLGLAVWGLGAALAWLVLVRL